MRIKITVKNRRFDFLDITEEEAIILRTLLNLSEKGVKEKLNGDRGYWDGDMPDEIAIKIGVELCNKVMAKVDEK